MFPTSISFYFLCLKGGREMGPWVRILFRPIAPGHLRSIWSGKKHAPAAVANAAAAAAKSSESSPSFHLLDPMQIRNLSRRILLLPAGVADVPGNLSAHICIGIEPKQTSAMCNLLVGIAHIPVSYNYLVVNPTSFAQLPWTSWHLTWTL